jgi:hypothetical protein
MSTPSLLMMSHTRTVLSSDADTMRLALMEKAGFEVFGGSQPVKAAKVAEFPWWDDEMSSLKHDANALYRRIKKRRRRLLARQRAGGLGRANEIVMLAAMQREHSQLKRKRSMAVRSKKRAFWRNLKAKLDPKRPNDMRVINKIARRSLGSTATKLTLTEQEVIAAWRPHISGPPPMMVESETDRDIEDERWTQYILSGRSKNSEHALTVRQVQHAIDCSPRFKAPGMDGITNEIIKLMGEAAVEKLTAIFNGIVGDPRTIPKGWKRSLVAMLEKVENPKPDELRPITLLSCVAKTLEIVLKNRLQAWASRQTGKSKLQDTQAGFRRRRDCIEPVWQLIVSSQRMALLTWRIDVLYLDVKKAFDSVPRVRLTWPSGGRRPKGSSSTAPSRSCKRAGTSRPAAGGTRPSSSTATCSRTRCCSSTSAST